MILREHISFDSAQMMVEAVDTGVVGAPKKLYMKGIFLQGGIRNLNERVYPVTEIANAVEHVNSVLSQGQTILGECDHPEELTVNLDRVSHMITQMWMDGPSGMGKLQIIDTLPKGAVIRALIEAGAKLGVSSRGSGNVNHRGEVSDFEIVTVDIVHRPSAPNAYPRPVYESLLNGRRGHAIDDLSRAVMHDPKAQTHLVKLIRESIEKLK